MEIVASVFVRWVTTLLFVAICLLLIVVILLQKGRGGGLAGAFGGAGGHSAFGAKTGDVFTWVTVALTAMFVTVAVIGNVTYVPDDPADEPPAAISGTGTQEEGGEAPGTDLPAEGGTTSRPGG